MAYGPNWAGDIAEKPARIDALRNGGDVRQWRTQARLTQLQVATWLDISPGTVLRYEGGQEPVPAWYVVALAGLERLARRELRRRKERIVKRVNYHKKVKREAKRKRDERMLREGYW